MSMISWSSSIPSVLERWKEFRPTIEPKLPEPPVEDQPYKFFQVTHDLMKWLIGLMVGLIVLMVLMMLIYLLIRGGWWLIGNL